MKEVKMTISKTTVNETLQTYLEFKGLNEKNTNTIMKKLHREIATQEKREKQDEKEKRKKEREREKKIEKRTKTFHGTSCPRIMTKEGELLAEF